MLIDAAFAISITLIVPKHEPTAVVKVYLEQMGMDATHQLARSGPEKEKKEVPPRCSKSLNDNATFGYGSKLFKLGYEK